MVGSIFIDTDEANKKIDETSKKAETMSTKISKAVTKIGDTMTSIGTKLAPITAGLTALGTLSVNTSASFEDGMLKVQSLSGATAEEFEKLTDTAKRFGETTAWSARDVADAMGYMALAGWDTNQILDGTSGMLSLASASGEDLATVTDILTDAMTAFGDSAQDAERYADVLATTQAKSNTTVGLLGEAFKYVAPLAGTYGYKLEDVATALGSMANAGVKGSMAGTSLSSIMTRLATDAGASSKSLGALGVLTEKLNVEFYNADGSTRNLSDLLKDMCDATQNLSVAEKAEIAEKIAGQEAQKGLLAILNQGSDAYATLEETIKSCNGASSEMATNMESGVGGSIRSLKSALEGVTITIGEKLAPYIESAAEKIKSLCEWFQNLSPETQDIIIKVGLLVAALSPVLIIGGKLISGVGSIISAGSTLAGLFSGLAGHGTTLASSMSGASGGISDMASSAGSAAGSVTSAGASFGELAGQALKLVAVGASFSLVGVGIKLIADSCIALADAGTPAIAVMGGLLVAVSAMAVGAAALAPALTAGAAGLVAFGGAVALIGAGIGLATAGIALLATQLPTISEYGASASVAIIELSGSIATFGASALVGGAGATVLGAGLAIASAGAVAFTVSGLALSACVTLLSGSVTLLSAGITLVAGAFVLLSGSVTTFNTVITSIVSPVTELGVLFPIITVGATALTTVLTLMSAPMTLIATSTGLTDLALLALTATFATSTISGAALDAVLELVANNMKTIASTAKEAESSMDSMLSGMDVLKSGVELVKSGFDKFIESVSDKFTEKFTPTVDKAMSDATTKIQTSVKQMTTIIQNGMQSIVTSCNNGMSKLVASCNNGMSKFVNSSKNGMSQTVTYCNNGMQSIVTSCNNGMSKLVASCNNGMSKFVNSIRQSLSEAQQMFKNVTFEFNQHIAIPHFSLSGSFDAETGEVPSVSVSWYKNGAILTDPMAFGINGDKLMVGGEAGDEAIAPIDTLLDYIRQAVSEQNNSLIQSLREAINELGKRMSDKNTGDIVIPVYLGTTLIDDIVINAKRNVTLRSGGMTSV